jgi:hypothetical protein
LKTTLATKAAASTPEAIMHLNMLFALLYFTTFLHTSLDLAVPNETPVNNTIVYYGSSIVGPNEPTQKRTVYYCAGHVNTPPAHDW